MIKREELNNPNSCMSRAYMDEMTFVLLGRDAAAADTVYYWTERRIAMGKNGPNDPQIQEARRCAHRMREQYEARQEAIRGKSEPVSEELKTNVQP